MIVAQPGHRIGELHRPLFDQVLTKIAEIFDVGAVAAANQRDSIIGSNAAGTRDADCLVLIGPEADGKESEMEVGGTGAQLVDDVLIKDVRLAKARGVALVLGSSGTETGLKTRNPARIAEGVGPVAGADEELVLLGHVLIDPSVEVVVCAFLLPVSEVVVDGSGARRQRVDVEVCLTDRIDQVWGNDVT